MLGVVVVYLGLIVASLGGLSVLRPLSFLAIRTRRQAALVLALGFMVSVMGGSLPARETRVATPRTQLDQFAPVYQFSEFHSIRIAAPKEQVYRALKLVTADEIALFRTLTWLGHPGPEKHPQPAPTRADPGCRRQNIISCSGRGVEPRNCSGIVGGGAAWMAPQRQANSRRLQGTLCDYQSPRLRFGYDELPY